MRDVIVYERSSAVEMQSTNLFQVLHMMRDVIVYERSHKEVAMIVAFSVIHRERHPCFFACRLKCRWLKLVNISRVEIITSALIHIHIQVWALVLLHQLTCIILLPSFHIISQIAFECFLSPRHCRWVTDWCKCRATCIYARVLECNGQGSVTAHGVAHDRDLVGGHRKLCGQELWQLLHYVIIHLVILRPIWRCGIHIEACTRAKIVTIVFACDSCTAR